MTDGLLGYNVCVECGIKFMPLIEYHGQKNTQPCPDCGKRCGRVIKEGDKYRITGENE